MQFALARGIWLSFDGNYRRSSTGKDKPSSRRVGNHVDVRGRRAYPEDIPQPTTGRGRGKEQTRDQKRSWKSLPVIYIEPRIFGNRGKYPKVVSARTGLQSNWWRNGTVQGIEMQPGDTLMPRLQWHYNTVHSPLSGAYGFIGARLRFPVPINAKDSAVGFDGLPHVIGPSTARAKPH